MGTDEQGLEAWRVEDGRLTRDYKTTGWPVTLLLAGAIAFAAETDFHHPELVLGYDSVTVRLVTHDAGDTITDKDRALARRIEELALYSPPAGSPLSGPSQPRVT